LKNYIFGKQKKPPQLNEMALKIAMKKK